MESPPAVEHVQQVLGRAGTFLTHWSAFSIDTLGDQITYVAMPLVATMCASVARFQ